MCLAFNYSQEIVVSITHELNEVKHMKSRVSDYYEFTWLSSFFFCLFVYVLFSFFLEEQRSYVLSVLYAHLLWLFTFEKWP